MRRDVAEESDQSEKPPEQPAKKREKVPLEVQEKKLSPRPSFWPAILALALLITCVGVITNPILLGLGAALTIAAIIGWMLERH